jgi:hypothetical protein
MLVLGKALQAKECRPCRCAVAWFAAIHNMPSPQGRCQHTHLQNTYCSKYARTCALRDAQRSLSPCTAMHIMPITHTYIPQGRSQPVE